MSLATALIATGIGLEAGSAYAEGRALQAQYKGEQAMAEYNAAVAKQNAEAARQKGIFDQFRQLVKGREIMGTMVARQGISGARLDVGAPLLARHEQAAELELENLLIGYESQIRAGQYQAEAAAYGMEAKYARQRAKFAGRAGIIGAGAKLLTGFRMMKAAGLLEPTGKGAPVVRLGSPGVTGYHIP